MPLKVHVTLVCGECGKTIPVKGKTFKQYSRRHGSYSGILLPDVYVIEAPQEYNGYNDLSVARGFKYLRDDVPEDEEDLVCSEECAVRRIGKLIKQLKPEEIEKD